MRYKDRKRLYLTLGIESAEVENEVSPDDFNEADSLSANSIDESEEINDFAKDTKQLNDFTEATETAADLAVAVEAAIASGKGLNRIEATALTKALQASVGKYVTIENNLVPANESYDIKTYDGDGSSATGDSNDNNKEQTTAAKKGIKEGIKAFIKAIIEKLKSIGRNIANFIKSYTDRLTSVHAGMKKAAETLRNTPEFNDKELKFNILNLHLSGKFDLGEIKKRIEELTEIQEFLFGNGNRSSEEMKFIKAGIDAVLATDLSDWEKFRETLNGMTLTTFSSFSKDTSKHESGSYATHEFPGGRKFVLHPGQAEGPNQLSTIQLIRATKNPDELNSTIKVDSKRALEDLVDDTFILVTKSLLSIRNSNRLTKEFNEVADQISKTYDPKNESKMENNRPRLSSMANFNAKMSIFRFWMFDYIKVLGSNIVQLVNVINTDLTKIKAEQDKEDAKTS